nr:hypothetical protein [Tanacetum cinerariifolium]
MPPHKRLCLSTLGSRYEIGESSTARPIGDRGIDYGFVSNLDAKARRQGIGEVGYGIRDTWVDPAETVPEIAPDVNIRRPLTFLFDFSRLTISPNVEDVNIRRPLTFLFDFSRLTAPMTVGEVNTRVAEIVELHEHDTHDLYALPEDAQDSRTRISQRVAIDSQ